MESDNLPFSINPKIDIQAFRQFFDCFYPSVCIFANKYLKDIDLAKDFAQEAFIEFWKIRVKFKDIKAVKGFIYTVTRNKCLNHIKIRDIRENILREEIYSKDYFYELILEEETFVIVQRAVCNLAPQSRKIVTLSMEGNKNQDIAKLLNVSINTVKTLKKNAYKELRGQLKDHLITLFL